MFNKNLELLENEKYIIGAGSEAPQGVRRDEYSKAFLSFSKAEISS